MIPLFDGCYCSDLKVHPKNWSKPTSSLRKNWYIHFRFYDPKFSGADGKIKPKLVLIQGMNSFKDRAQRIEATQLLLDEQRRILQIQGFNPITGQFMAVDEQIEYEIDPDTPFIRALRSALEKLNVTQRVRLQIKSVIKGLELACQQMRYDLIAISKISRRNIRLMLDQVAKNSKKWSNTRYNAYRGYLMMLFKELVELEAAPANPIWDISKKPVTRKIKKTLTSDQRKTVDEYLQSKWPEFRNFVHLFFHSGARMPELLQVKPGMVDIERQKFRCIVKKRKIYEEVDRTIKSVAMPYWLEFLKNCNQDQFVFGKLFKPADRPLGVSTPARYWKKFVKEDLGIDVDLYSLKHMNTAEVVDQLDEQAAAKLNAHTSTAMVVQIYDVKQKDRQHNRIKQVNNSFA